MVDRLKLAGGVLVGAAAGVGLAVGIAQLSDTGHVAAQIPPMDTTDLARAVPQSGQVALSFAPVVKSAAPAVVCRAARVPRQQGEPAGCCRSAQDADFSAGCETEPAIGRELSVRRRSVV